MYGFLFRPRWLLFHALVLAAIVIMVSLGFWQLRRLDERRAFNDVVEGRVELPAVALGDVLGEPDFDPDTTEWRAVTASGVYLDQQILVFNRTQNGQAGDNVLTPLLLDGDGIMLVNRGFVPLGTAPPPPPATSVEVLGRVRPSQQRERGGLTDANAEDTPITEIRRVEIERIAAQLDGEVAPVYLDLVAQTPAIGPGDPDPVPPPELGSGPHLSYAFQWFIFSIAVAVGWVLAVRRSIAKRRRADDLTDGADEPVAADSPRPTAAAPASSTSGTNGTSTG
jgi:cytochrome oxidase assembly protein ShyY1